MYNFNKWKHIFNYAEMTQLWYVCASDDNVKDIDNVLFFKDSIPRYFFNYLIMNLFIFLRKIKFNLNQTEVEKLS